MSDINKKFIKLKKELALKEKEVVTLRKKIHHFTSKNSKLLSVDLETEEAGFGSFKLILPDELELSKELYNIFEFDEKSNDNLFKKYLDFFSENDKKNLFDKIESIKNGIEKYDFKYPITLPSNNKKWLECTVFPIKNDCDEVIGLKGIIQDITAAISGSSTLNKFFEASLDLQCIADESGYFIKISPSWSSLLGYTVEELCSQPFINFVHPDDVENTIKEAKKLGKGNLSINFKNRYIKKNGKAVYISWNSRLDDITGLFYCTARDITEDVKIKNKLISDLTEKEILLKEVHHRVKNNLQVISSLLSLQSNIKKVSPSLKKLYDDSQNRIKSMAAIHELFYRSESLNSVNFNEYINKIAVDILHSYKGDKSSSKFNLNIDVEDVYLNLDTAVPLGLIINEIITNSLKHGFSDRNKGEIVIKMNRVNKSKVKLIIGDDGIGFKDALKDEENHSLGMVLISSLIEQIDGEILQMDNTKGTFYQILFKI